MVIQFVLLSITFLGQLPQAGSLSNAGKTFVQTFNFNHPTVEDGVLHAFILSTDSDNCTITVTVDEPPLTTYTVNISSSRAVVYNLTVAPTRGIKLDAPCDFVVYGLNFATQSADGWLAYPVEALGREYVILGVEPWLAEPTQLTIVAANDYTTCTSTFPNGTQHVSHLNSTGVDYITSTLDMTGTMVNCTDKVTVLSGQRCSQVPAGCIACDHTIEQVPPKSTLGRDFALVPLKHQCTQKPTCCTNHAFCDKCTEIYRILAAENDTRVVRNGTETNEVFTLQAGQSRYILLSQTEISHLVSSKPVLLGQYFNGQGYESANEDPAFAIIPQIESYGDKYQAATCFPQFQVHFVNLVVMANSSSRLLLNGAPFLDANSAKHIPGTPFEAFQYQFDCSKANGNPTSFTISHADNASFGLFAYGFSAWISYGYPGGMNLNDDVFYTCAPPQLNLSDTVPPTDACNLTNAVPGFSAPTTFTDDQCCSGNSTLNYVDTVVVDSLCTKVIRRTWTLTDGCGRSISANQTGAVHRIADVYQSPPPQLAFDGSCSNVVRSNSTGEPVLVENCGTTLTTSYVDAGDNSTHVNRTWTIQNQCQEDGTLIFNVTISCRQKKCPCRHRPKPEKHKHKCNPDSSDEGSEDEDRSVEYDNHHSSSTNHESANGRSSGERGDHSNSSRSSGTVSGTGRPSRDAQAGNSDEADGHITGMSQNVRNRGSKSREERAANESESDRNQATGSSKGAVAEEYANGKASGGRRNEKSGSGQDNSPKSK